MLDLDQIFNITSSLLALILFSISFLSYLREKRKKVLFLSAAFFIYAVMNFLNSADFFYPKAGEYIEAWGSLLNFFVLGFLFLSFITKGR